MMKGGSFSSVVFGLDIGALLSERQEHPKYTFYGPKLTKNRN